MSTIEVGRRPQVLRLIDAALDEDLGQRGDVTSRLLPDAGAPVRAAFVARTAGVLCGLPLLEPICEAFVKRGGPAGTQVVAATRHDGRPYRDADDVLPDAAVAVASGPKAAILALERTWLNFLGRLSGVATQTRRFVDAARAANPAVQVLDTRKTLPGWRELDKYAVRCGGGTNHRSGLFDAVLLKDNHLAGRPAQELTAWLTALLAPAREGQLGPLGFIEVEVDGLDQFDAVCRVPGVDFILLDNFAPQALREAVRRRDAAGLRGRVGLEASGGVTLASIGEMAATGVERISVGALTHSAVQLDFGLDLHG